MNGTVDDIVSDHSPSTLELKDQGNGDFEVAWGGVSSLQLGGSLIWTEARRGHGRLRPGRGPRGGRRATEPREPHHPPHQGTVLSGKVRKTFVGGHEADYETPTGRLISRGQA